MKKTALAAALTAFMTICALMSSCTAAQSGTDAPVSLRCEHQKGDEVLLDIQNPRLSWINSVEQSAYQILVATSEKALTEEAADVWNSGKVESNESHLVEYSGAAMDSMEDYWWKVRVWDCDGNATDWSEPAHWTTGMFHESDWEAKWIGASWQNDADSAADLSAPMFRKEFQVKKGLVDAKAFVCGLGWFEMDINGAKVGDDYFVPGLTDYTERPGLITNTRIPLEPEVTAYRTLYLSYDITPMLKKGANAVSMVLGNGYFHEGLFNENKIANYGYPRLICQIKLEYADGTTEMVCSDETWKEGHSPVVFSNLYQGEVYDANLEVAGWDRPGLDDTAFGPAALKEAPMGKLTANMGPTDKVIETLKPVSFEKQEDGTWKIDFGKVISGWVRFSGVTGKKGQTLSVNHLSEYPAGKCEYIFAADGKVDFAPRFTWYVFREAVVSGIDDLKAENVVAEMVNTKLEVNSTFESSDTLFMDIERIWRQSQNDNMHAAVATDCPHRERLPYTGDGEIAMGMVLDNFDASSFYNKWLGDVKNSQHPETGYVPNGAPWEPCCGGGTAWGAAICQMPWDFYLRYGDRQMLESCFEPMKGYVRYMNSWMVKDGTISVERKTPDGRSFYWYNLGDWAPAFQIPKDALVHTFYGWLCADITAKTAEVLGDEAAAAEYSAMADAIRDAFNKVYYNPEEKSYGDFGSNVYALCMGVPEDRLEDVRATLRDELMVKYNGHVNVGFVANKFIYETLSLNGMGDVAFTLMNQRDFPSFGWWLEQGATTTWEQWNGNDSRNHPMFGGGLTWFYHILAGVSADPMEPGFKHSIIRPIPVKGLDNVSWSTETPYGTLVSKVITDGDSVRMEVTVPHGTYATVYVPKSVSAAAATPWDDNCYDFHEVGPGTYSF